MEAAGNLDMRRIDCANQTGFRAVTAKRLVTVSTVSETVTQMAVINVAVQNKAREASLRS